MTKLIPTRLGRLVFGAVCGCVAMSFPLLVGCNRPAAETAQHEEGKHAEHEGGEHGHEHGHDHGEGPHGGHVVELGQDDYHAEVVHDDKKDLVRIYLLDSEAKKPVTSATPEIVLNVVAAGSPKQFRLAAAPAAGDAAGSASTFELVDRELCELLDEKATVSGRFNVTIDGKPFVGQFDHKKHEH